MTQVHEPSTRAWRIRDRALPLGSRTLIMGIVNVTPDSFSDGGRYLDPEAAIAHGLRLEHEGADLLDIGGESTRPGAEPVPEAEELRRVEPVVEGLRARSMVPLSVDTRRARVARRVLELGAHVINDVTALGDPDMGRVVAEAGAGIVLMHMKGEPRTMQDQPAYDDVVAEVREHLRDRAGRAEAHGIPREAIVVDPGIGFGKRTGAGVEDNATLLRHLAEIAALGYPVLVGASRKRFLGNLLGGVPTEERLAASLGAAAVAAWNGASILRVHDVAATRRALAIVDAVRRAE